MYYSSILKFDIIPEGKYWIRWLLVSTTYIFWYPSNVTSDGSSSNVDDDPALDCIPAKVDNVWFHTAVEHIGVADEPI